MTRENWRDATKVAVLMMIQEETEEVPIAKEMGLFGVFKYVEAGMPEPWDPQAQPKEPEPEDDVKIRVEYLDSGYFDDHFDLTEKNHLVGKTLVKLCSTQQNPKISESLKVLGWILFAKWDEAKACLETMDIIDDKCASLVRNFLEGNDGCSEKESLLASLDNLKCEDMRVEEKMMEAIISSVQANESDFITKQKVAFHEWNKMRENELEKQLAMYQRELRREAVLMKKKEMEEEEEVLFFFEREEDYERQKENKIQEWRRKLPSRPHRRITLKPKATVEDSYVPPTV